MSVEGGKYSLTTRKGGAYPCKLIMKLWLKS